MRTLRTTLLVFTNLVVILAIVTPAVYSAPHASFAYEIDPGLAADIGSLPRPPDDTPREIAVMQSPAGEREQFVQDEIILTTSDEAALDQFISQFSAQLLGGGPLPAPPPNLPPDSLRPAYSTSDSYLLRVDLASADLTEFPSRMASLGFDGNFSFNSDEAVRLIAIISEALSNDLYASPNTLMLPVDDLLENGPEPAPAQMTTANEPAPQTVSCVMCQTEEHPLTGGGYENGFKFSWLNDADFKVTRAWQFYDLLNLSGRTPKLALVDAGFAANNDFPATLVQYDIPHDDNNVLGEPNPYPTGGTWHGYRILSIAMSRLNNQLGSAGVAGQMAFPYLVAHDATIYGIASGIAVATYWGADVINVNAAGKDPNFFEKFVLDAAVSDANSAGAIVSAPAGNDGIDLDGVNILPCETSQVLCVGGVEKSTKLVDGSSNYGDLNQVEIWGPYNACHVPDPGLPAVPLWCSSGTCSSAGYTAGVLAMMKAVFPAMTYAQARSTLQSTANTIYDSRVNLNVKYLNVLGAVQQAASLAGSTPEPDLYEPNDSPATAASLSPGTTTGTIIPGDFDYFEFVTTDFMDVTLTISFDETLTANNSLGAFLDSTSAALAGSTLTLSQNRLAPGTHTLYIYGASSDTINCYHITFSMSASSIAPDYFDNPGLSGNPRNDTFADRAIRSQPVDANLLLPMDTIADLNFDQTNDIDYFEGVLEAAIDPQSGQDECLSPGNFPYGEPGFTQGKLTISAYPDSWVPGNPGYTWPFELTLYDASGAMVNSTNGLNLTIDCPHDTFPDGVFRFSVRAVDGRRNFYRVFIHYQRWDQYIDAPGWVWDLTQPPLFRILPPYAGLIPWYFPKDQGVIQEWFEGTLPGPIPQEFGMFDWQQTGPLDLSLFTEGGKYLEMTLYDNSGGIIGGTSAGSPSPIRDPSTSADEAGAEAIGQLHLPNLDAGIYVLGFGPGDFGTPYSVSIGPPYLLHLPLVMR